MRKRYVVCHPRSGPCSRREKRSLPHCRVRWRGHPRPSPGLHGVHSLSPAFTPPGCAEGRQGNGGSNRRVGGKGEGLALRGLQGGDIPLVRFSGPWCFRESVTPRHLDTEGGSWWACLPWARCPPAACGCVWEGLSVRGPFSACRHTWECVLGVFQSLRLRSLLPGHRGGFSRARGGLAGGAGAPGKTLTSLILKK